jgi:hypothetical protein
MFCCLLHLLYNKQIVSNFIWYLFTAVLIPNATSTVGRLAAVKVCEWVNEHIIIIVVIILVASTLSHVVTWYI